MKKIIFIFCMSLLFGACEEEIDVYGGENGIYFDTKEILLDTVDVAWGLKVSEVREQVVRLRVKLFGDVAAYDRAFAIEIESDPADTLKAVEGIDYRPFPLEYTIPANKAETFIEVPVLRSEALKKEPRRLTIKLKETPQLKFLYSRQIAVDSVTVRDVDTQRVIKMTEDFPQPWWWRRFGQSIFGDWSVTKSVLICDQLNIDREIWIGDLIGDLTTGFLKFAGQYMHRYLQEHPTLDEDGEPMQMGPDSQV